MTVILRRISLCGLPTCRPILGKLLQYLCAMLLLLCPSCDLEGPMAECPYNARLEYWHVRNTMSNVLPDYIHSIREYIFDEKECLVQVNEITDSRRLLYGEFKLSPGKYHLVAWANIDSVSRVENAALGSHPEDLVLYPKNPYVQTKTETAFQSDNERLYYASDTFRINEYGVTRKRIDFTHSHLRLGVQIRWTGTPPEDTENFNMRFRHKGAAYRFTTGENVDISSSGLKAEGSRIVCRIPEVIEKETAHRKDVKMGISRTLRGEFITYRLRDDMHPVFCAYAGDSALMKEIDLSRFFRTMYIGLDRNLCQEYDLLMEIAPDGSVMVSLLTVRDWEDGGVIGMK